MTPLRIIREELVQKPEVIDIEVVGARLKHHDLYISIDNAFCSDCGDTWKCSIDGNGLYPYNNPGVICFGTSLRSAILSAFKMAEDIASKINIESKL